MTGLALEADRAKAQKLTESHLLLKQIVLNSVTAQNTRRNYSKALEDLFTFANGRFFTPALLQQWKDSMGCLAASTVNVKLAAAGVWSPKPGATG